MNDFITKMILKSSRTMLRVNTNTLRIRKYALFGVTYPDVMLELDSIEFLEELINSGKIYEEDIWQFRFLQLPSKPLQQYLKERNGSVLVYRYVEDGKPSWSRLNIILPDDFGQDNPEVLLISYAMSHEEAVFFESTEFVQKDIHKILKADHLTGEYETIREYRSEWYLRQRARGKSFDEMVSIYRDELIHPEDIGFFNLMMDRGYISQYFEEGNTRYTFFYRRKIGTMYLWSRLMVVPSRESTREHPIWFYYVYDEHQAILKLLDVSRLVEFMKRYPKLKTITSESYYENMLTVLFELTNQYLDCYMVDLERDLYIKYKFRSRVMKKYLPDIGSYSESSAYYIDHYASGENAERLKAYCTSEKLREAMQNRMTLEYNFLAEDGQMIKTVVRKIESIRGVPTKVLCYSVPVLENQKKLKIRCFGNFEVFLPDGSPVPFARKQSKQFLAYLIDKQGYPVSSIDIVEEMLEKDGNDRNAIKYVSTLVRRAIQELEAVGFGNVIIKEQKTVRVNRELVDCDYYRLMEGDVSMWENFHNEYMKEYSWAEETAAELQYMATK